MLHHHAIVLHSSSITLRRLRLCRRLRLRLILVLVRGGLHLSHQIPTSDRLSPSLRIASIDVSLVGRVVPVAIERDERQSLVSVHHRHVVIHARRLLAAVHLGAVLRGQRRVVLLSGVRRDRLSGDGHVQIGRLVVHSGGCELERERENGEYLPWRSNR